MLRQIGVLRGALAGLIVVLIGAGVAGASLVGTDAEQAGPSPASTVPGEPVPPTTSPVTAPSTTKAQPTSRSSPSRPDASRTLCTEIGSAIQTVYGGRVVAGGLQLSRAVNAYGDTADSSVVAPARRILATALQGDLESSASAAEEASSACAALGSPFAVPGIPDDPGGPGLPGPYIPCDFPPC